ncbi:MAG: hypothetical protein KA914_13775 [Ottowia sp.]|nr:hypothetical protein [Ottowia sp.]HRL36352.1 hypothetical protein [Ottowia beijingensis]
MNANVSISRSAADVIARGRFEPTPEASVPSGAQEAATPSKGTSGSQGASKLLRDMALGFGGGAVLAKLGGGGGSVPQTPAPPMDIKRATEIVDQNFDAYDTAKQGGGKGDGKISQDDLRTVAANKEGKFSADQQAAAQFLLDSQAGRNFLDVAGGKGNVDGTISRGDVDAAKAAIADGSYVGRMLDTAANGGGWFNKGPDGTAGKADLDAALNDPGVPRAVKDAIRLAREGQPNAEPEFLGKLTEEQAQAASALVQSKEYQALTPEQKAIAGQAFRDAKGDAAFSRDIANLVGSPAFQSANDALKTDRLREVALLHSPEFKSLPAADQQRVRDALAARKPGDDRFAGALSGLVKSQSFQKLSADEKTAVLSQIRNYPDARVAENFGKLLDKGWYSNMSLQDKQRTLKAIAYMTAYSGGDRAVLDNTLNKLLDPSQDYSIKWDPSVPSGTAHSNPGTHVVSMSPADVGANNQPVNVGSLEKWQIINAVPHEINHAIDDVHVSSTYGYLDKEYQAYYTGFKAENGRPMTRAEAVAQWRGLLDPKGAYGGAATGALANPQEAQKIYDELSRLTGVPVDAKNYQQIMNDPSLWKPPYDATRGPDIGVPSGAEPQGNTDNH